MTEFIAANILWDGDDATTAAASYLSWVAYPERNKVDDGAKFFEAVTSASFKATGKNAPPEFRMKRERILPKINAGLHRIATRRIPAAWMAHRIMARADAGGETVSIRGAAGQLCEMKDDGRGLEVDNVRRTIWYESLPALPMTLALPLWGDGKQDIGDLLSNPNWVLDRVRMAQGYCRPIASALGLKVAFCPVLTIPPAP